VNFLNLGWGYFFMEICYLVCVVNLCVGFFKLLGFFFWGGGD